MKVLQDPGHCLLGLPPCPAVCRVVSSPHALFQCISPIPKEGRKGVGLSAAGVWHRAAPGKGRPVGHSPHTHPRNIPHRLGTKNAQ